MSSNGEPALPGSTGHERPNLGILLRDPFQEVVRRVSVGLADAGFDDLRPAHTAVFQHIEAGGSPLTHLAKRAQITKQAMGYLVADLERRGDPQRRPAPRDPPAPPIPPTHRGRGHGSAAP